MPSSGHRDPLYSGVDKLITSLDFAAQTPTFQFTSKRSLMTDLGLNEEQFLDTGLLAGCDHLATFLPLCTSRTSNPLWT